MKNNPKTFEEALAAAGTEKEKAFFANTELLSQIEPDELAYKKLKVCARAWNTDEETKKVWEPNWNNSNEYKYFPWMWVKASDEKPAGFGFSLTDCVYDLTDSGVGSRLCFQTSTEAIEFGKTFADLYKDFWLIP